MPRTLIVRKKSGALRFCLDLRAINAKTIPDRYNLPRIDSTLDALAGAQWFRPEVWLLASAVS